MARLQRQGKTVQVLLISQTRSVLCFSSRPTNRLNALPTKLFRAKRSLFLIPALYFPPNPKINQ